MALAFAMALGLALAMALGLALAAVGSALAAASVLQVPFAPQMHQCHSDRSSLDQSRRRVGRKSAAAEDC
jgi:hypothetical protein